MSEDPVFEKDGKWYFWDETWSELSEPFDSEEECREELNKYIILLG